MFTFPSITCIGVDGGQVAKSKLLPVLAFGLFGLAAKGTKDRAFLMAYTGSGEFATFEVESRNPTEVRAGIAPILRLAGVPFADEPAIQHSQSGGSQGVSVADQIERLAALHRSGALTDEEFAALKAKLTT